MLRTRRRDRIAEPERERITPKTPPRKVSDKKIRSPGTIAPLKTDAPRGKETEPKRRRRCDDPETIPGATSDNVANDQSGRSVAGGACAGLTRAGARCQYLFHQSFSRIFYVSFANLLRLSFSNLLRWSFSRSFSAIFCVSLSFPADKKTSG